MGRWQPGARGRLQQAAMELYRERGFDQTTVAEIAARAGLTERTFFRYFVDKREVLFAGSTVLQDALVAAAGRAPGRLRRSIRSSLRSRRPASSSTTETSRVIARPSSTPIPTCRSGNSSSSPRWQRPLPERCVTAGSRSRPQAWLPRPGSRSSRSPSAGGSTAPGRRDFADYLHESVDALKAVTAGEVPDNSRRSRAGRARTAPE